MLNKNLIQIITQYIGYNIHIDFDVNSNYWGSISLNENIPKHFFMKYENELLPHFKLCIINPSIDINFVRKNINKMNDYYWNVICRNPNIPQYFYNENIKNITSIRMFYIIRRNIVIPFFWFHEQMHLLYLKYTKEQSISFLLSYRPDITEEFVLEYINEFTNLQWVKICKKLPYTFLLRIKQNIPSDIWNSRFALYESNINEMNKLLLEII